MKKLLPLLLGLMLWHPAFAAYSVTNVIDEFGTSTISFTSAASYTFALNDRVILVVVEYSTTDDSTTVTDTNGNTWTKVAGSAMANYASSALTYVVWECKGITTAGASFITVTFSAAPSHAGMAGLGVTGLSNSAASQSAQQGQTNPGTGAGAVTSGSITPASQPAILFQLSQAITGNFSTGLTAVNGTSHALTHFPGVDGAGAVALADLRLVSTSATAATFTYTHGASDNTVSYAVIVPEAGGGATCTHNGWNTATGAFSLPTAGSGSFWLKTGAKGSTDCSATQYWQPGGVFGAN